MMFLMLRALPILALAVIALFLPHKVFAATYTVTSTADSGAGTLRQAIIDANGNSGADQIDFAISGAGPHTIVLASGITITDRTKVNGLSQTGSVCNGTSSTLKVVLEGNSLATSTASAVNSEINGFVFGVNSALSISSDNNTVRCNFFGTTADGTAGVATTGTWGLTLWNGGTTLGGNSATDMNLFGNSGLYVPAGDNQTIKNNQLGTDITGMTALAGDVGFGSNTWQNITISHNLIRHMNMIYSTFNNFTMSANKIGTNITGTAAIQENLGDPIWIRSSFNNSTIGGPTEADGNLIAGAYPVDSNQQGIALAAGGSNLTIQNNKLGVNADATGVIGNYNSQLVVSCANSCVNIQILDNIIGGSQGGAGIAIANTGASELNSITVKRNYIGTNKTLDLDAGNTGGGISISGSISHVLIGGSDPADANYIYNNGAPGVTDTSTGFNSYLGNSIYGNEGQGIDFPDYWNPDPENDLNFPIIYQADEVSGHTNVGYALDVPAGDYRIEFFSNTEADPTGYGEGETYLGSANITSDGTGEQNFSTTLSGTGYTHMAATATLIDPDSSSGFGPTSEFGNFEPRADLEVASDDGATDVTFGDEHQYTFTVTNNGSSDVDHFEFEGMNQVLEPNEFSVDSGNSTATTPGSFADNVWTGLLKPGETLTITYSGNVVHDGNLETSRVCVGTLKLEDVDLVDPDDSNNCGTDDDTEVTFPVADPSLTKTLVSSSVTNGQTATYKLTVTNNGPDSHPGSVGFPYVYDLLPPGLTFSTASVSSQGNQVSPQSDDEGAIVVPCENDSESTCWYCFYAGESFWPGAPGTLAVCAYMGPAFDVGQTVSINISATVDGLDPEATVTNKAMLYDPYFDPDFAELANTFESEDGPFNLANNSVAHHTYDPNAPPEDSGGGSGSGSSGSSSSSSSTANSTGLADTGDNIRLITLIASTLLAVGLVGNGLVLNKRKSI